MPDEGCRFRWRGRAWHLTYKGHLDHEALLAQLHGLSSIAVLGSSVVHESSDAEAPYDHTHLCWWWARAPDLNGAHLMDFKGVHPHAVTKKSLKWVERIFTHYHHGYKADGAGRASFKAPVGGPWQELPEGWEWSATIITEVPPPLRPHHTSVHARAPRRAASPARTVPQVSEAPDLLEGAMLAGVSIRSMHDVLLVQSAKRPAAFEHNFARDSFRALPVPEAYVSGVMGALHVYGPINIGKTEWALAQFDNPLLVTQRNDLLDFRPGWHDGIVVDKVRPRDCFSLHECEALCDYTQPASIKCLYRVARIPKKTRKIVVTNDEDVWPADPHGILVGRRVVQMQICQKTY